MLVKYVGRLPAMKVEYNGQRYQFLRETPVKDIPYEVYDFIKRGATLLAGEIVPVEVGASEDTSALKEENAKLREEVARLKKELGTGTEEKGRSKRKR